MKSAATSVAQYLAEMAEDRRAAIAAMRKIILANLPAGYDEVMRWGMITFEVPLSVWPKTYNGQPLMYAALANQKHHMAVYLCSLNCTPGALEKFRESAGRRGKKVDVGAACIRFGRFEELDLDAIASTIFALPPTAFAQAAQAKKKNPGAANRQR